MHPDLIPTHQSRQFTPDQTEKPGIIYALVDPRNGSIRYIGKSHRTSHRRLRRHLSPCYLSGDTHKERWIRSLLRIGFEPGIIVLEECETAEILSQREIHWIAHYRTHGANLTNATPGGDGGGGKHTVESKAKIRAALLGKPKSEEHRRRVGLSRRGLKASEKTRLKMSLSHKGRPSRNCTEESRIKGSRSKGGKPFLDQYGTRYETQHAAARLLGFNLGHINEVLHGKRNTVKGYVFRFVDDLRVQEFPG